MRLIALIALCFTALIGFAGAQNAPPPAQDAALLPGNLPNGFGPGKCEGTRVLFDHLSVARNSLLCRHSDKPEILPALYNNLRISQVEAELRAGVSKDAFLTTFSEVPTQTTQYGSAPFPLVVNQGFGSLRMACRRWWQMAPSRTFALRKCIV